MNFIRVLLKSNANATPYLFLYIKMTACDKPFDYTDDYESCNLQMMTREWFFLKNDKLIQVSVCFLYAFIDKIYLKSLPLWATTP